MDAQLSGADDLYGLAYNLAAPRVRFILPGGCEVSTEHEPDAADAPLRAPRQWFAWVAGEAPAAIQPRVEVAAAALAACAADALASAPGARLVLGGFSQGALVSLQAASTMRSKPAALVQLAAQAPAALPAASLAGIRLLVVAGEDDPVAPVASAHALLEGCSAAGALAKQLVTYLGAHEVTMEAVDAIRSLLGELRRDTAGPTTAVDVQ